MNEKLKKTVVRLLPYLFVALAATCLGKAWRMAEDADATQTLFNLPKTLEAAFSPPIPSPVSYTHLDVYKRQLERILRYYD